jgi:DNA-binding transcriptional LysR family regulator
MELRHLRYFVAVAEERSFTRAAEVLGIKQPPLSLQIRQLEKELGTPLFRRLTRSVELTAAGALFLEQARKILTQVDQAKVDVGRRARGESGEVSLGASGACYFQPLVTDIMSEFQKLYPEVVVCPQEAYTAMVIAGVHAGKYDAAFVRFGSKIFDGLALELIAQEDAVAALPAEMPLARMPAIPLASLAKEKFVLLTGEADVGYNESVLAACAGAGFHPNVGPTSPGVVSAIAMVACGYGVAVVPETVSRLRLKGVAYIPIEGRGPKMPIYLVYRKNDKAPAVRNLVGLVQRVVPSAARIRQIA